MLTSVCFCDKGGGHQLFQWLEVSEEISQLLEHSNPGALDTRWQIKRPPWKMLKHLLNPASPDLYRTTL